MRKLVFLLAAFLLFAPLAGADRSAEVRTLDGSGNNRRHPDWGKTNTQYQRVARTNYADGIAKPVGGPATRYVSNRVFNDVHQNLFSENSVTQWGFVWGQFMDHTFGLREEAGGERRADRVQHGRSARELHEHRRARSRSLARLPHPVPGGAGRRAQQINTVSSYIDGFSVYSGIDRPARVAA